jgi:hypothetical protein
MSLWHNWLYRRLLLSTRPVYWSIGILDFCAGRSKPQQLRVSAMTCYVIFGQGHHEQGGSGPIAFGPGSVLTFDINRTQTFACDTLSRFLIVTSEAQLNFNMGVQRLTPGSRIVGSAASYYLVNGSVIVRANGEEQKIESATAFSIAPQIEYTVENIGKNDVQIIGIGAQATANREVNRAAFTRK